MTLSDEKTSATRKLHEQMDAFYASCPTYSAFQEPSNATQEWNHVKTAIVEHDRSRGRCRVLEFGAGRSGFAEFLGELRSSVDLTLQDVTPVNEAYLRARADRVEMGSLLELEGEFDVIFSTFVLEHICEPEKTLERLLSLLAPGGSLFLFCPRYDFPFFISHSADHYGMARRMMLGAEVLWKRVRSMVTRRPAFIIHLDPAALRLEWMMDRDAIHWASLVDLRIFFRRRGQLRKLPIRAGSLKDWMVKKLLRINVRFIKARFA